MAKETVVRLIDDIEGGTAQDTFRYTFDSVEYEIDLNEKNAARFREAMDEWIASSRRVGGRRRPRSASGAQPAVETKKIREWAQANGHAVGATGKISESVRQAYAAAN